MNKLNLFFPLIKKNILTKELLVNNLNYLNLGLEKKFRNSNIHNFIDNTVEIKKLKKKYKFLNNIDFIELTKIKSGIENLSYLSDINNIFTLNSPFKIMIVDSLNLNKETNFFNFKFLMQNPNIIYYNYKWVHGMFTNWNIFKISIEEYNYYKHNINNELVKKNNLLKYSFKKILKKEKFFLTFKNLKNLPNLVIFLNTVKNEAAIKECNSAGIPTILFSNTNGNPFLSYHSIFLNTKNYICFYLFLNKIINYIN